MKNKHEWISVGKRLPKIPKSLNDIEKYVVIDFDKLPKIAYFWHDDKGEPVFMTTYYMIMPHVSHWLPLPPPQNK